MRFNRPSPPGTRPPARCRPARAPEVDAPLSETNAAVAALDDLVRDQLDQDFTRRSDDGLLEHLQELGSAATDTRMRAVGTLAQAVQDRRLYKMIGRTPIETVGLAALKHKKLGSASRRRQIERNAAAYAGLEEGWQVVLWLPAPAMRPKVAEVLVDDGNQVNQLAEISPQGGQVVEQHKKLWAISVYASRDALPDDGQGDTRVVDALLAFVKDTLDVPLTRWDGQAVLGRRALAEERVADLGELNREQGAALRKLGVAPKGGSGTFKDLKLETWKAARLVKPTLQAKPPANL